MAYGWQGSKVQLVPLDKEKHLENALRWLNDPEITLLTTIGDTPIGRLAEEEFFDRFMRMGSAPDPAKYNEVGFAVETLDEEHIGFTGIAPIQWRDGVGMAGTILGRRDLWGQGYGTDTVRVRTRYAFEVLNLRMLLAEVLADNAASLKMLARVGYREVGRIPQRHWVRGSYRDGVTLMLDRRSFEQAERGES